MPVDSLGVFRPLRELTGPAAAMLVLLTTGRSLAEPAKAMPVAIPAYTKKIDFEANVLPIFKRNCLACHNATDAKGELVMESPATIQKGGSSGPVVEPKKGMASLLLQTAAHTEKPFMPPKNNKVGAELLKPEELAILKAWIDQGATGTVKAQNKAVQWKPLPPGLHPILALAVAPDGQFAACGRANQIFIYHVPTGQIVARLTDPKLAEKSGRSGYKSAAQRDFVQSLAFSPDGLLLASGEFRQVKLWQREPNLPQFTLGEMPATAVAASADGKWIATAGADFVIHLWSAADGKPGPDLKGHTGRVSSLSFSADGTRLLSASADKSVRIWQVAEGKAFAQAEAPQPVSAAQWVLGEKEVATAGGDPVVRRWALPAEPGGALAPQKEIAGHTAPVTCLAASADGRTLFTGSKDKSIRQWALDQNNRLVKQVDAGGPVDAVALSPDGKTLAAAAGPVARLWTADKGTQLAEFKGDFRAGAAQAEAERKLTFAKNEVAYWKTALDAATKAQPVKAEAAKKAAEAFAAANKARDEKKAAVAKATDEKEKTKGADDLSKAEGARTSADGTLAMTKASAQAADQALAEAKTKSTASAAALQKATEEFEKAKKAVTEAEKLVRTLAFAPNSLALAAGGEGQIVQTRGALDGSGFETFPSQLGAVSAMAYLPDGRLVSAAAQKGAVIWKAGPSWTLARAIGTGDEKSPIVNRVSALEFSPDGKTIATGGGTPSRNGEVKLWRTGDGSLLRDITPSHSDSVYGLDFSPDGKLLATASADKFVKVFDVGTGKLVKSLAAHTHYVLGVGWRADGRSLVSSGADKAVKIWSFPTGEVTKSVENFGKEVNSVRFMGYGGEILAASGDTKLRLMKEDGSNVREYPGSKGYILAAATSPDGQVILGGGQDSILRVWNGATGKLLFSLDPPAPEIEANAKPATTTSKPAP